MFFNFGRFAGMEIEVKLCNLCELVDSIVIGSPTIKYCEIGSKILMLSKIGIEEVYFVVRLHDSEENESKLIALCSDLADAEQIFNREKNRLEKENKNKC